VGITLGTDTLVDVGATCSSGPATAMRGVPLGMAEGTQVTDEVPRSAWRAVATMADAGIAHGALDADHILVLPDGAIRLVDLRAAVAGAPRALLQADRAQLLVTTALIAGPDRAVDVAVGQLGADELSELLPYLQPAALTARSRRAVREGPDRDLSSLRTLAARAAGRQPPALEPLRRVTWASLLQAALLAFGVWFLVSSIAGLGLSNIADELENASGAWLCGALLLRLVILLLAVGAVVVISVAVPRLRRMLKDRLVEARETLSVLRQPTKLAQMFGGNLAARIALAVVLSACLHAFGQRVPLGELLVVNTVVALFAGLMPVLGGLGVYEGALTGGLVLIGIPDEVALAATLTYRMVTFYLPPIWGWYAMRTLKQEEYL